MKLFLETTSLEELRQAIDFGVVDGVLTSLSLRGPQAGSARVVLGTMIQLVDGPICATVVAANRREMVTEARELLELSERVVVRLPGIRDGIKACRDLSERGVKVSIGMCYQPLQALAAAKAGAAYVGPFLTPDDGAPPAPAELDAPVPFSEQGMPVVHKVRRILENYRFATEILVSGVTDPEQLVQAALAGAHVAAVPMSILDRMLAHPLTEAGLKTLMQTWSKPRPGTVAGPSPESRREEMD